jgi:hypothetical protein
MNSSNDECFLGNIGLTSSKTVNTDRILIKSHFLILVKGNDER